MAKNMAATAIAKSTEINQIKAATVTETATVMETATVTVTTAAVTRQWWRWRRRRRGHIAGAICLMMLSQMQYFGWGEDWGGHASSHFPAAHIKLEVNRCTFGWGP
jgi:hypothetical protein